MAPFPPSDDRFDGADDDSLEPVSALDQAVSAVLDGEATDAERALVADNPAAAARTETFLGLQSAMAITPPDTLIDDQVAAAMAEFAPPVSSLAAARDRRDAWYRRVPLGAVAAGVVVLALIGAATQLDRDTTQDTATAAFDQDANESAPAADEATVSDGAADTFVESGMADSAIASDVVMVDTVDQLLDVIASRRTAELSATTNLAPSEAEAPEASGFSSTTTGGRASTSACDPVGVTGADPATLIEAFPAIVAGSPVTVVRLAVPTDGGDTAERIVVIDDVACTIAADVTETPAG